MTRRKLANLVDLALAVLLLGVGVFFYLRTQKDAPLPEVVASPFDVPPPPLPPPPPPPPPPPRLRSIPLPRAEGDVPGGIEEGVPGGVEGGIPGGIVGGVVGGLPDAPPPPQAVRVGGQIREPRKLKHVDPVYPDIAKQARVQGIVILEVTISPQGKVTEAKVLRGIPLLDQAAIEAVRQWVYAPTLLNGVPVPVIMTVTVNFRLQ